MAIVTEPSPGLGQGLVIRLPGLLVRGHGRLAICYTNVYASCIGMAQSSLIASKISSLLAAGTALLVSAAPANAVNIYTQNVGPVAYSMLGTDSANNSSPPSLSFAPFVPPSGWTVDKLVSVRISTLTTGTFGGSASLVSLDGSNITSFTIRGTPTFRFSNNQSLSGASASGILTPNTTSPGIGSVTNATVSGGYSSSNYAGSSIAITDSNLRSYFTTGNPTIDVYKIVYSSAQSPNPGATSFASTTFNGNLYISYQYEDVPAPSVMAGAAVAFAYTRRLRVQSKRIRSLRGSAKL
ncbi:MAG: hypothetical protein ACK5E6_00510 [Cyanobacteriota bacterium]